jgi:hypothetical protein
MVDLQGNAGFIRIRWSEGGGMKMTQQNGSKNGQEARTHPGVIAALAAYLIVIALVCTYALLVLWPSEGVETVLLFGTVDEELGLLLIVAFAGALGSLVHAATSFITYVGNRQLINSWILWYVMRPFIGMTLALVVYFAVRGGVFVLSGADIVNPFGAAAIAGGVGMFSRQAADKLRAVFEEVFRVKEEEEVPRADPLETEADEEE